MSEKLDFKDRQRANEIYEECCENPEDFAYRYVALEKEAARYLWLRDIGDETWVPLVKRNPSAAPNEAEIIDAAIDQAMQQE